MKTKDKIAEYFLSCGNVWKPAAAIMEGLTVLQSKTKSSSVYAILHQLTKRKYLEARTQDWLTHYRLAPEVLASLQPPDASAAPPELEKKRKPKVFWTSDEKHLLTVEVARLLRTMPNQSLHVLLELAQRSILMPDRQMAKQKTERTLWWLRDRLKALPLEVKVDIPAVAAEAPVEPPKMVEAAPTTETKPLDPAVVAKLLEKHKASWRKPQVVHIPDQPKTTPADFSTGQLIDEVLARTGGSLKAVILSILGSPEVERLVKLFVPHETITQQKPEPAKTPEVKSEVKVAAPSPKFQGAGPYTGPVLRSEPTPIPKHDPNPPQDVSRPRLKKLLIVGLLKSNHVDEVKRGFSDKFDLRFYHPDEALTKLRGIAPNMDQVIVLTEQVSHKHTGLLQSMGVQYTMQLGSIGRLTDYLSHLNIPLDHN